MLKNNRKYFIAILMIMSISFAQEAKDEVLLNQILYGGASQSFLESSQNSNNVSQLAQIGQLNTAYVTQTIGQNVYSNRPKNVSLLEQVGTNNDAAINQTVNNSYGSNMLQNFSSLTQLGSNLTVSLDQIANNPYQLNYSVLIQLGLFHTANINMNGSGNTINLEQRNMGNAIIADINGNENESNILQDGISNSLKQYIVGDAKTFNVSQTGTYNQLNQIETGFDGIKYSVYQKGPGMKVTIVNGSLR